MLTKEQKNGLIESLYKPMFEYVEGIVKPEENPSLFASFFKKKGARTRGFGLAFDLECAAIGAYEAKARFEARIMAILDAYIEGKVEQEKLPDTVPVATDEDIATQQNTLRQAAFKHLAEFNWADLKSEDYKVARSAIWTHDWIKGICGMFDDTRAAYQSARDAAGYTDADI